MPGSAHGIYEEACLEQCETTELDPLRDKERRRTQEGSRRFEPRPRARIHVLLHKGAAEGFIIVLIVTFQGKLNLCKHGTLGKEGTRALRLASAQDRQG